MDNAHLDGNAAAGILGRIFAPEITSATARCAHCGLEGPVAEMIAYIDGPGTILRCQGCNGIQMRVVEGPHSMWFDGRGMQSLRL